MLNPDPNRNLILSLILKPSLNPQTAFFNLFIIFFFFNLWGPALWAHKAVRTPQVYWTPGFFGPHEYRHTRTHAQRGGVFGAPTPRMFSQKPKIF